MYEFKGKSWFKLNDKLVLMISDEAKDIYQICFPCDVIICSEKIIKKHGHKFKQTGATIVALD